MKPGLFLALILTLLLPRESRGQNSVFTYRGRVLDNGTNFTGIGHFKFALVTSTNAAQPQNAGYTTYWSNDGTSSAGGEPDAAVTVPVADGLFTVACGDTSLSNMTALAPALFTQPNLQLRIWFDDGVNGFSSLGPAQNLTAVPYSFAANGVNDWTGTLPVGQLPGLGPLGALPAPRLTNAGSGATLTGVFIGDGSGITNANAGSLFGSGVIQSQFLPPANGYDIVSITNFMTNGAPSAPVFTGTPYSVTVHHLAQASGAVTNLQLQTLRSAWTYSPTSPSTDGSITPVPQNAWPDTMPMYVNFGFDGSYFIFGVQGKYDPVVIAINNTDWPTTVPVPFDGNFYYYKVQFSSTGRRQITLKMVGADAASHPFLGVWTDPSSAWWPAAPGKFYRMIVLGSSFVEEPGTGTYTKLPNNGYAADLMYLYNNLDAWASGSGGTGIANNNGTRTNYLGRVLGDVVAYKPDIVLIDAGANDSISASNSVYVNLTGIYQAIQTNLPHCQIIPVTSPFWGTPPPFSLSPNPGLWTTYAAITNANAANGITNFIDTLTAPVFPTGSNPSYWNNIANHPTEYGLFAYAEALSARLASMCPQLVASGYSPATLPLTVPTGFAASLGTNVVNLSWIAPVAGATSYNLKRGPIAGGETLLTNLPATSYADTAVTNGTTYYYVVSSIGSNSSESPNSYEISATPVSLVPNLTSLSLPLVRWLSAATNVYASDGVTPVAPGGQVGVWKDSSGHGNNMVSLTPAGTTFLNAWANGQPAVKCVYEWPGGFTNNTAEPAYSLPSTFVIVLQPQPGIGQPMYFQTGPLYTSGNAYGLCNLGSGVVEVLDGGSYYSSAFATTSNPIWYLLTVTTSSEILLANGIATTNGVSESHGPQDLRLGTGNDGKLYQFTGAIAEFSQYTGIPTAADIMAISNYCAVHYGIHN